MLIVINNHKYANEKKCSSLIKKLLVFLSQIKVNFKVIDNSIKSTQFIINNEKNISGFIFSSSPERVNKTTLNQAITCNYVLFNINKPILGICFGHQLIAKLNLGNISSYKNGNRYIGNIKTNITDFPLIKNGIYHSLHYSHYDFLTTIPYNYVAGGNTVNKLQHFIPCIKHKDKNIFGIQFHPEYNIETDDNLNLYFNFLDLCKVRYDRNKLVLFEINNITNKLHNV